MTILSALLLAVTISIDTLACGFAYGTSSIKVPMRCLVTIDLICSTLLGSALFLGLHISKYISLTATQITSAAILISIGIYKLIEHIRKSEKQAVNAPHIIAWKETFIIALTLSLDGIAVGIGAAIHNTGIAFCIAAIVFSLITDIVFFTFGNHMGKRITKKTRLNLSWLSGAVLIILGIIKFI